MPIPELKSYSEDEIFNQIILPLTKEYPEIRWFADPQVSITQEVPGKAEISGWTQQLAKHKDDAGDPYITMQNGAKYIELERTLSSIVFFHLFYDGSQKAYEKFTSVYEKGSEALQKLIQVNKDQALSFESFQEIHKLARKIAKDSAGYQTVVAMLIYSDIGKTPRARNLAKEKLQFKRTNHDDFIEELLSKMPQEITSVLKSYGALQAGQQTVMSHVASAMRIHLGHVLHIEGGHKMFHQFSEACKRGKVSKDVFDLAFLIQYCDVAAAAAQVQCNGLLSLTERIFSSI